MKKSFIIIFLFSIFLFPSIIFAKTKDLDIKKLRDSLICPNIIYVKDNYSNEQRKHLFLNSFCFAFSNQEKADLKRSKNIKEYLKKDPKKKINLQYNYLYDDNNLIDTVEILYQDLLLKEIAFLDAKLNRDPIRILGPKEITISYYDKRNYGFLNSKYNVYCPTTGIVPLKVAIYDGNREINNFYKYDIGTYYFKLRGENLLGDVIYDDLVLNVTDSKEIIEDISTKTVIDIKNNRPTEEELKGLYLKSIKDKNYEIEDLKILSTTYKTYDRTNNIDEILFRLKTTTGKYNDLVMLKKDELPALTKKHYLIITITVILLGTIISYLTFPILIRKIKYLIQKNKQIKKGSKKD